jgi:hypothetical protein
MLRNLSAGNITANNMTGLLATYLHSLKEKPFRLVSLLAIFIIPIAALVWWYYTVAMSLGAVLPLQTASETSGADLTPDAQSSLNAVTDTPETSSRASSNTSENMDVNISNDSTNTNIEIDGESVTVPENGSSHQVIENEDGKTTVDIQVDSNTSGTNRNRSSTNINLRSSSSADVNIKNRESN